MKVVILAGGFGTRLAELTGEIPKPMVPVGGKPILWHIMNHYSKFGYNEFVLALGYKAEIIKHYFLNYPSLNSDFTVCMKTGDVEWHNRVEQNWKVTLVDTGLNSMTGGRVKRMQPYIKDEPFLLTYGDGLSDIDLDALLKFHKSHGKMVTVTAVRPSARFGELEFNGDSVTAFKEKPQMHEGWINGGYFVVNPEFFELIDGDDILLEREPLEKAVAMGELMAFKHHGFWQCMDTKRDHELLEELWVSGQCPWTNL